MELKLWKRANEKQEEKNTKSSCLNIAVQDKNRAADKSTIMTTHHTTSHDIHAYIKMRL